MVMFLRKSNLLEYLLILITQRPRKNLRTREFLLKLLTKTNKFNTNIDRTITNIEFDTGILVIQKIVNSTSY